MSGRVDSLLKNRNALFWTLHIGGWLAYGVSQYLGTLIYDYKKEHATGYLTVICVAAVSGFLLTPFLGRIGMEGVMRLRARVVAELKTTFASHYTSEISLKDMLDPTILAAYNRRATGEKYLVNPSL